MKRSTPRRRSPRARRRGMASLQVVMTLGTLFVFSVAMYGVATEACRNLYGFIATLVGAPY